MARKLTLLGLIGFAFFSIEARASGDFGCGAPRGALLFRVYSTCNSLPFLSPGNDSRLNLELLLIDAGRLKVNLKPASPDDPASEQSWLKVPFDFEDWHVAEPGAEAEKSSADEGSDSYAEGEGSRCSTANDGLKAFESAVKQTSMPIPDKEELITARNGLKTDCAATAKNDWVPLQGLHSLVGREFATYIEGANAFYGGDYAAAAKLFADLKSSSNAWVKETARYMIGRTQVNAAQAEAFGEWGELKQEKIDREAVKSAGEALDAYLKDYPKGEYTASARGLLRRVAWLGNDPARLAESLETEMTQIDSDQSNVTIEQLIDEADQKLLPTAKPAQLHSQLLLAVLDLMKMRIPSEDAKAAAELTLADLEAQKAVFAKNPALYSYLLAAFHIYVDSKPDQALALLPTQLDAKPTYFGFSQQSLRVMAMEAAGQAEPERKLLLTLLPQAKLPLQPELVQLALARLEERTGHLDRALAPGSPIQDPALRTILVEHSAGADLLRQRIRDKRESPQIVEAALYTLLYKELTGQKYADFVADLALVPAKPSAELAPFVNASEAGAEYHCPAPRELADALIRSPADAQGLNCIGELVRLHQVLFDQDMTPAKGDLGGNGSTLPDTQFSRMDGYLKVIANQQAPAADRAYSLYRAIHCYAPSGYNDCGKQDFPVATRKLWFQTLHKDYPTSSWAKASKIYW